MFCHEDIFINLILYSFNEDCRQPMATSGIPEIMEYLNQSNNLDALIGNCFMTMLAFHINADGKDLDDRLE